MSPRTGYPGDEAQLVGERYELGEVVGRGRYSTVRKAFDVLTHDVVAIKIFDREEPELDPGKEAERLKSLVHPNLAKFIRLVDLEPEGKGTPDSTHRVGMVMEYVSGVRLSDVVGKLRTPEAILNIVTGISSGLAYAHSEDDRERAAIVHCDLHLNNVLILDALIAHDYVPKIVDWGVSRLVGEGRGSPGHIDFTAPEAWTEAVPKSDYWSLGIIAAQLVAGQGIPDHVVLPANHRNDQRSEAIAAWARDRVYGTPLAPLVLGLLEPSVADRFNDSRVNDFALAFRRGDRHSDPATERADREAIGRMVTSGADAVSGTSQTGGRDPVASRSRRDGSTSLARHAFRFVGGALVAGVVVGAAALAWNETAGASASISAAEVTVPVPDGWQIVALEPSSTAKGMRAAIANGAVIASLGTSDRDVLANARGAVLGDSNGHAVARADDAGPENAARVYAYDFGDHDVFLSCRPLPGVTKAEAQRACDAINGQLELTGESSFPRRPAAALQQQVSTALTAYRQAGAAADRTAHGATRRTTVADANQTAAAAIREAARGLLDPSLATLQASLLTAANARSAAASAARGGKASGFDSAGAAVKRADARVLEARRALTALGFRPTN